MVKTSLKNRWILARLEGFEPPTLRSEVRLKALLAITAKKTRALYLGLPQFTAVPFYLVSRVYGNIHGKNKYDGGAAFSLRPVDVFAMN